MMTTPTFVIGPEDFKWWRECQPTNFYDSDAELSRTLSFYCRDKERLAEYQNALSNFGAAAATVINEAAEISNQPENLPRLQSFNSQGQRVDEVLYHPSYHAIGTELYQTGVMKLFAAPSDNVLGMAFLHLLSMNGEAGHACPFACTAGLIKAVDAIGTAEQKQRYLPHLLDPAYDKLYHAAQYLTESHGGSDVGANRTVAEKDPAENGAWLISGEKWFCSNVTAHLAVLTARPQGAPEGTRGLGLFLLPQRLPDHSPNGIEILTLKDKVGTRSLATAEVLFKRAKAEALGPLDSGFKSMMTYVINSARLSNCLFASGASRRAFLTAEIFVSNRSAFGRQLIEFPLVYELVTLMKAKSSAILAGSLCLARKLDDFGGVASGRDYKMFRILLNISKYRASVLARETVLAGIECLGGNGTIETFSILPRLLRDCIVYETWEGPHNVLVAQTFRDFRKDSNFDSLFTYLESVFQAIALPQLGSLRSHALERLNTLRIDMEQQLNSDATEPSRAFRSAIDVLGDLFFLSQLCTLADWERRTGLETDKLNIISAFWNYIRGDNNDNLQLSDS